MADSGDRPEYRNVVPRVVTAGPSNVKPALLVSRINSRCGECAWRKQFGDPRSESARNERRSEPNNALVNNPVAERCLNTGMQPPQLKNDLCKNNQNTSKVVIRLFNRLGLITNYTAAACSHAGTESFSYEG
jgi:hypothetical protein